MDKKEVLQYLNRDRRTELKGRTLTLKLIDSFLKDTRREEYREVFMAVLAMSSSIYSEATRGILEYYIRKFDIIKIEYSENIFLYY